MSYCRVSRSFFDGYAGAAAPPAPILRPRETCTQPGRWAVAWGDAYDALTAAVSVEEELPGLASACVSCQQILTSQPSSSNNARRMASADLLACSTFSCDRAAERPGIGPEPQLLESAQSFEAFQLSIGDFGACEP